MTHSALKSLMAGMALATFAADGALAGPYDEYEGTELVVLFPVHPHYNAVLRVLPQFTEETGINVEVDQLEYLKMRDMQALELTKSEGDYDLMTYVVFSKADFVAADQLDNLAKYFMNPKLADPTYDAADLIEGYVQNIGVAGGEKGYLPGPTGSLFGLPFGAETSILAYRSDIFEKHGLTAPTTVDEMVALSCEIPELEPGMGGIALRSASGQHASHGFLLELNPLGGKIFDEQWNPIVNNAAGVQAATNFKTMVDCGPEGAQSFTVSDAADAFAQGRTAMFLDSISFASQFGDPEKSQVVGSVGYALHPEGEIRASQTGGFGIGIPSNSPNKEAAFLLMQWLTSKHGDKLIAMQGGSPSRFSTYADPEVIAKYPYAATFGEALKFADPDWRPIIPAWGKINNDLGITMSQILTEDADIQEALDGLAERTRATMLEAGYYTWSETE